MCIFNATVVGKCDELFQDSIQILVIYLIGIFFSYQAPQIQRRLVCPPYQWLDNGTKKRLKSAGMYVRMCVYGAAKKCVRPSEPQ